MKKVTGKAAGKSRGASTVQRVGAAALVMLPLTMMSTRAEAQTKTASSYNPIKYKGDFTILGVGDGGKTFYKGADGRIFIVDPKTGDLKFMAIDIFLKISEANLKVKTETFYKWKSSEKVNLVGVDPQGNVIQMDGRGQRFYLNAHGDMVTVK